MGIKLECDVEVEVEVEAEAEVAVAMMGHGEQMIVIVDDGRRIQGGRRLGQVGA